MDLGFFAGLADARPGCLWSKSLLRRCRVAPIGATEGRGLRRLPSYLGGWQVAMLPFARNDATRYTSPTKVLEYLAAGLPVVSTSILWKR